MLVLEVGIIGRSEAISLGAQRHLRREISVIGVELCQGFFKISSPSLILSNLFLHRHFFVFVVVCLISISVILLPVRPELNRRTKITLEVIQISSLFGLILVPSEVILLDASLDGLILISFIQRIMPFSIGSFSSLTLMAWIVPEVRFGIVGVQL